MKLENIIQYVQNHWETISLIIYLIIQEWMTLSPKAKNSSPLQLILNILSKGKFTGMPKSSENK